MDYVLFGMGYGATLMLVGWALRTFGPQLKYSTPPQKEDPDFLVQQRFWVRFVQGLGGVIAIAGTTMVLMTFVVVLMNPTDETGMTIAMAIWGFVLIIVLVWCWLYLSRFGLAGIWSQANGYGFRNSGAPAASTRRTMPAAALGAPVVMATPASSDDLSAAVQLSEGDVATEAAEADDLDGEGAAETDSEPTEAGEAPVSDPVYDFGDGTEMTVPKDVGGSRAEALRRLRERQARTGQSSQ